MTGVSFRRSNDRFDSDLKDSYLVVSESKGGELISNYRTFISSLACAATSRYSEHYLARSR